MSMWMWYCCKKIHHHHHHSMLMMEIELIFYCTVGVVGPNDQSVEFECAWSRVPLSPLLINWAQAGIIPLLSVIFGVLACARMSCFTLHMFPNLTPWTNPWTFAPKPPDSLNSFNRLSASQIDVPLSNDHQTLTSPQLSGIELDAPEMDDASLTYNNPRIAAGLEYQHVIFG